MSDESRVAAGVNAQGPFAIQLPGEHSPFAPDETLQCWVGDGERVLHAALAVVFDDIDEASSVAGRWPQAEIVGLGGASVQDLSTVGVLACRSPMDLILFFQLPERERLVKFKKWVAALRIADDRCRKVGGRPLMDR